MLTRESSQKPRTRTKSHIERFLGLYAFSALLFPYIVLIS